MTYQGHDYIVVVDFYSKYPEIAMLERKTAACVMLHMKSMFARHGIPGQLVSDNMPFASREFNDFAKEWGIKLTTSSLMYPQSNGQSECAVQTMKNMLKKANAEGRDPYLALLAYRNTAVAGMSYSPAQMLMSRSLNTKVPTLPSLLQPKVVDARPQLEQRQQRHKAMFDRGAHKLTELHPGDVVRVRHNNVCQPAIVRQRDVHPRSYIIERDGYRLRRNRRQLLKTAEDESPIATPEVADACRAPPADIVEPNEAPPTPVVHREDVPRTPGRVRSSGRVVVRPAKLEDYACKYAYDILSSGQVLGTSALFT